MAHGNGSDHLHCSRSDSSPEKHKAGTLLVVWRLGLCVFTAEGLGSILGWGTKILQASRLSKKKGGCKAVGRKVGDPKSEGRKGKWWTKVKEMGTMMGHERSRKRIFKSAAPFFTQADSTWHQIFKARFFFFWNATALQCCVSFHCTMKYSLFFLFSWSSLNYSDRCLRAVIPHLVIQHLDDKIHTPLSTDLSKHQADCSRSLEGKSGSCSNVSQDQVGREELPLYL